MRLVAKIFLLSVVAVVATRAAETSAEIEIGERLFRETRFSQNFAFHSGNRISARATSDDSVLNATAVAGANRHEPGDQDASGAQSVSCASCHLSAHNEGSSGLPVRRSTSFADFSARSKIPEREDGRHTTPRNTASLVDALVSHQGGWGLLHWDGEFTSAGDLIKSTYTGRNFGWLPGEQAEARRHFARVIREDAGRDKLAQEYGGLSYAVLFRGVDVGIPEARRLPAPLRFDPMLASDDEVINGCARLVALYLESLQFSRDSGGRYDGSPYDAFLEINRLPRAPRTGETSREYARRLHNAIAALQKPRFVDESSRRLVLHDQPFRFGELELRGMRIFFRGSLGYGRKTSAGNCAECHVPPNFTDFAFHNTGVAQQEYDAAHGLGAFARLAVPQLAARAADYDRWLPPTDRHPKAKGIFLMEVSNDAPNRADLGLWNCYGDSDEPAPQAVIERMLNRDHRLDPDGVLALTLGRFKTPTVRDLGQSGPYFHTGGKGTIEDVIKFYREMSSLAHENKMRNAPPEYFEMSLGEEDIAPLAAFLRSLNEDYRAR
jgi:cytochrome c peroxidase